MRNHLEIAKILGRVLLCLRISYGYDNLSTGRTSFTWMSSIFEGKWSPSLAVDGQFDKLTALQLSCAISQNWQFEATWRIDLGDVRSIKNVQIYYRNDDPSNWDDTYRGRFAGFFLYASNTSSKEDGYLCYHKLQNGTNSPPPIFTTPCVAHARYIIYYNERIPNITYPSYYSNRAYTELCEVVILGCEHSGVYGTNCDITCPLNCQERRCWIDNGTCLGCADGYKGIKCDTQCDEGKNGEDCSLDCGNCKKNEACHHVTGECLNGCSPGYLTALCNERCAPGTYGEDCVQNCSDHCANSFPCNVANGHCNNGCNCDWQGEKCDMRRPRMLTEQSDSKFVTGMLSGVGIVIAVNLLCMAGFIFARRYRRRRTNKGKRSQDKTGRQTTYVNEVFSVENKKNTNDDYQYISDIPNDVNQYVNQV